jgi:cytoskeleton protein RodZ
MMNVAQAEVAANHRGNPGAALRAAREKRGWSVAEVATQLNLPALRLAQLEAGEFDKMPGYTFARGYVRAYAKLLGLDQAPLVADFDQITGSNSAGSSVHALGRIDEPARYSQGILWLISVLLLLALGGLCFYWWQQQGWGLGELRGVTIGHVEVEAADGSTQIHALDEPEDPVLETVQEAPEKWPGAGAPAIPHNEEVAPALPAASPERREPPPQSAPSVAPAPAAVAPQNGVVQPAAGNGGSAPLAIGEGLLGLTFTAECWIQVTDASGKVLASGLKRPGDRLDVRGRAPMELRLGFASGAQVSYNGKAVDLTPFISNETARLKLDGQ